jgi:uncharacterized protein YggU (UPF0235/DUF167 family)
MSERKFRLHDGMVGAAITVQVTPRACKNEISEILDDGTIKVRLIAGPEGPRTNHALVEFLAGVLQVPADQLAIVAGENGRDKLVTINNLSASTVHTRIINQLG